MDTDIQNTGSPPPYWPSHQKDVNWSLWSCVKPGIIYGKLCSAALWSPTPYFPRLFCKFCAITLHVKKAKKILDQCTIQKIKMQILDILGKNLQKNSEKPEGQPVWTTSQLWFYWSDYPDFRIDLVMQWYRWIYCSVVWESRVMTSHNGCHPSYN